MSSIDSPFEEGQAINRRRDTVVKMDEAMRRSRENSA